MLVFDYADGILDAERLGLDASILCEQVQALTADAGWHQEGLRLVLVDRGGGITTRLTGQPGMRSGARGAARSGRAVDLRAAGRACLA